VGGGSEGVRRWATKCERDQNKHNSQAKWGPDIHYSGCQNRRFWASKSEILKVPLNTRDSRLYYPTLEGFRIKIGTRRHITRPTLWWRTLPSNEIRQENRGI